MLRWDTSERSFWHIDRKYDIFGRTYLFNIDGYHLQQDDPSWEVSYVVDAYHAGNVSPLYFPSPYIH
jgi:hypothetical protein